LKNSTRFAITGFFGMLSLGLAHAQDALNTALPIALQAIYEKPQGPGATLFKPIIVTADNLPNLGSVTVFDTPVSVKSRADAREEQLAWFLYISKIESTPDGLTLAYGKPYNGKSGTVILKNAGGVWEVADHKQMHSSSGARYFYGELYDGVKCRNGSEMARRWTMYVDVIDAMTAKRARTPEADLPTKCPGDTFPDVLSYQQMKKLLNLSK